MRWGQHADPVETPIIPDGRPARTQRNWPILLVTKACTRATAASWERKRMQHVTYGAGNEHPQCKIWHDENDWVVGQVSRRSREGLRKCIEQQIQVKTSQLSVVNKPNELGVGWTKKHMIWSHSSREDSNGREYQQDCSCHHISCRTVDILL